ncbi:MAG: PIN domain-containing protein [Chloroflexota bacterium]
MLLFDTSVWAWRKNERVDAWFRELLLGGELAICEMVALEILSGAPNREWYEQMSRLLSGLPWIHMGSREWRRALEVHLLVEQELGTNVRRSVKHAGLLIAAAAEAHDLALLHFDRDFDHIQQITGQPMQRVDVRGSR